VQSTPRWDSIPPRPPGSAALLAAVLLGACGPIASQLDGDAGAVLAPDGDGGASVTVPPDDGAQYLAFQRDFQTFQSWIHFDVLNAPALGSEVVDGGVHPAGNRTVYINHTPEAGRTTFATGTIIVKMMETGETLAMVKRGGAYNVQGARGWEWFELQRQGSEWVMLWRGITPPVGFCYAGIVGGACNTCHLGFSGNDFIGSAPLQLRDLGPR
jgi:hypothetical protein